MPHDPDEPGEYASSPCMSHEFAEMKAEEVARWRKAERERLIALRLAVPAEARARAAEEISRRLDEAVEIRPGLIVSAYWPFRGELDLRPWLGSVVERGGRAALPVVVAKAQPLVFRDWRPGAALERGVWNIPVPAGGEEVAPDVVIAPLVGVDPERYRLGYGGGFFDRTLAALGPGRLVIGVGLDTACIPTVRPLWHDIPMDLVLTAPVGES